MTRVAGAALGAALLVLTVGATFARLYADDFCFAADAQQYDPLSSAAVSYQTWSPRYSYIISSTILYQVFSGAAPTVTALLCIGVLLAGVWLLVRGRVAHPALIASGITLGILWVLSPIEGTLYWMPAAAVYVLPFGLVAALVRLLATR